MLDDIINAIEYTVQNVKRPEQDFVDKVFMLALEFALIGHVTVDTNKPGASTTNEKKFTSWSALRKLIKLKLTWHHQGYESVMGNFVPAADPDLINANAEDAGDSQGDGHNDGGYVAAAGSADGSPFPTCVPQMLNDSPKLIQKCLAFVTNNPLAISDFSGKALRRIHAGLHSITLPIWQQLQPTLSEPSSPLSGLTAESPLASTVVDAILPTIGEAMFATLQPDMLKLCHTIYTELHDSARAPGAPLDLDAYVAAIGHQGAVIQRVWSSTTHLELFLQLRTRYMLVCLEDVAEMINALPTASINDTVKGTLKAFCDNCINFVTACMDEVAILDCPLTELPQWSSFWAKALHEANELFKNKTIKPKTDSEWSKRQYTLHSQLQRCKAAELKEQLAATTLLDNEELAAPIDKLCKDALVDALVKHHMATERKEQEALLAAWADRKGSSIKSLTTHFCMTGVDMDDAAATVDAIDASLASVIGESTLVGDGAFMTLVKPAPSGAWHALLASASAQARLFDGFFDTAASSALDVGYGNLLVRTPKTTAELDRPVTRLFCSSKTAEVRLHFVGKVTIVVAKAVAGLRSYVDAGAFTTEHGNTMGEQRILISPLSSMTAQRPSSGCASPAWMVKALKVGDTTEATMNIQMREVHVPMCGSIPAFTMSVPFLVLNPGAAAKAGGGDIFELTRPMFPHEVEAQHAKAAKDQSKNAKQPQAVDDEDPGPKLKRMLEHVKAFAPAAPPPLPFGLEPKKGLSRNWFEPCASCRTSAAHTHTHTY